MTETDREEMYQSACYWMDRFAKERALADTMAGHLRDARFKNEWDVDWNAIDAALHDFETNR